MFGSISDWFYRDVAGIRPADDAVGFNKIIIQPQGTNLMWAKASYQSVLGMVSSNWKKIGNRFELDIIIPVNATATVTIPAKWQNIGEGGSQVITGKRSVYLIAKQDNKSVFQVGSGIYHFTAKLSEMNQ
jgi:hypothetical protein